MPVGLSEPSEWIDIAGIKLAATAAGIRYQGRNDLVLVELPPNSSTAAVFTRNQFCAAPVQVARQHLKQVQPRYLLINSGNANAGTGPQGLYAAQQCCELVAEQMQVEANQVLPFSTGVIGQLLPLEPIQQALPNLAEALASDQWLTVAKAIMTTDTVAKLYSVSAEIGSETVNISGFVKGAGMIRPDMATMLCYVFTDAEIEPQALQSYLERSLSHSFHAVTVDGDTSTNDACVLSATAQGSATIEADNPEFQHLLNRLMLQLAQSLVRDGEGATKFIEIEVLNAASDADAREVAFTVAHSPLVKSAFFASDPNWGRVIAAAGRAEAKLDMQKLSFYLGSVCLLQNGVLSATYQEQHGAEVMRQAEIKLTLDLGLGDGSFTAWTSDLSYDYVRINAEYRS